MSLVTGTILVAPLLFSRVGTWQLPSAQSMWALSNREKIGFLLLPGRGTRSAISTARISIRGCPPSTTYCGLRVLAAAVYFNLLPTPGHLVSVLLCVTDPVTSGRIFLLKPVTLHLGHLGLLRFLPVRFTSSRLSALFLSLRMIKVPDIRDLPLRFCVVGQILHGSLFFNRSIICSPVQIRLLGEHVM